MTFSEQLEINVKNKTGNDGNNWEIPALEQCIGRKRNKKKVNNIKTITNFKQETIFLKEDNLENNRPKKICFIQYIFIHNKTL